MNFIDECLISSGLYILRISDVQKNFVREVIFTKLSDAKLKEHYFIKYYCFQLLQKITVNMVEVN